MLLPSSIKFQFDMYMFLFSIRTDISFVHIINKSRVNLGFNGCDLKVSCPNFSFIGLQMKVDNNFGQIFSSLNELFVVRF